MSIVTVPYHLDERLPGLDLGLPVDREVTAELPAGGRWERMAALYEAVAGVVAAALSTTGPDAGAPAPPPLVVSGDCTTSLGVLAGLQRAGHEVGIVWFDAHADFHTEDTTTSGYLGGMPLALAVGTGTPTLPVALGLRPVAERDVVLVDARDTDPGEQVLLDRSDVTRVDVVGLRAAALPDRPLYLHLDLDVCDPGEVPELLYPAPGGPGIDAVLGAVRQVASSGRVAAVGVGATWRQGGVSTAAHEDLLRQVHAALQP